MRNKETRSTFRVEKIWKGRVGGDIELDLTTSGGQRHFFFLIFTRTDSDFESLCVGTVFTPRSAGVVDVL